MTNHEVDFRSNFSVDNRKIIIAFVLLFGICVACFVVGFKEGKRQGYQVGYQTALESMPRKDGSAALQPAADPVPAAGSSAAAKQEPADQPLDWYKSVSRRETEPEPISPAPTMETKPKTPETQAQAAAAKESKPEEKKNTAAYTVQVGAFLHKNELEIRAKLLRDKGFEYWTEDPQTPGDFYLLKVGKFSSRAEAVAMQLRLKKSGFPSFVKTK
jgi:cell division protein FtsN